MKWELKSFDEIGFIGRGKSRHRPRNAEHLYGGIYPFVQTGDIKAAGFRINEYSQTYNEAGLEQSKLWKEGTLCITIAANIADTAILGVDACFPDSVIGFVPYEDKSDVRFVKYFFDIFQARMKSIAVGAAQDNLSLEKLLTFKIPTPPLPTQRKIASILSAYDDLIENNLKRIKLLEEKALCEYKLINEFKNTKILGDVLKLNYGKSLSADNRNPGMYPVYGSSGVVGFNELSLVKGPGVIVGRKGNVGTVFWSHSDFFPIDTVYYVESEISLYFLYFNLKHSQHFDNSDAAVPGLNRTSALSNKIHLPSLTDIKAFEDYCKPIFCLMNVLQKQNTKLREGRDILLPKLMSGQIEV
ncbi:MAG: restriction endonuclease subunit S [Saprospiraceae bacterium]|nr:restriction endonuclease subunit S [Candidatus Vicinibacter affinis]MBK6825117.1 restriction endonuclease subunit S [Candidatus Vicinibacter affinis]MBK7303906.1 restriction endonuclease subunit S [Candidatus Vicinibacter affinis]MBK7694301.1 restriction endonuclease subunit S [Candidatus Vicinibacter affinis]MBK7799094.1 restriction endonuclease subunit S [Candidatus Vicinibacter affinis]